MQGSCEIGLEKLGDRLRGLRLSSPAQQQAMEQSLAQHGQLTAVLANREGERLEVVDGFKRLRAAGSLRWATVRVHELSLSPPEAKLRMMHSNAGATLSDIEQAWLVRALYRDDGVSQPQIAQLLGRHKSWVSRRLLLAEGLCDQVHADLRLGLVSATAARQLARLPRGNQPQLASLVARRGLTSRQTEKLVEDWLTAPDGPQRQQALDQAGRRAAVTSSPSRPPARSTTAEWLVEDIEQITRRAGRLQARLLDRPLSSHGAGPAELVGRQLRQLEPVLTALVHTVAQALAGAARWPTPVEPPHPRGQPDERHIVAPS